MAAAQRALGSGTLTRALSYSGFGEVDLADAVAGQAKDLQRSVTARDRDRLDQRFRLLVGSRRGLARHQALRHAVAWSYDLLDDAEESGARIERLP